MSTSSLLPMMSIPVTLGWIWFWLMLYSRIIPATTAALATAFAVAVVGRLPVVVRPPLNPTCVSLVSASQDHIRILDSPGKGYGAYSAIRIPSGAWVGEYIGEVLEVEQVKSRYWNTIETTTNTMKDREEWIHSRIHRNQGFSGDYLFDVGDDLYIDGEDTDVSNWCRFINHAEDDECNLETRCSRQIWNGNEMVPPRLWFVARRDIAQGEELLFDYGDRYWNS